MNKDLIPPQVSNISYNEVKRLIEDFQKIKSPDAISPESLGVILKLILQYPNEVVWDNDDIWEFINQVNTELSDDIGRVSKDLIEEIKQRQKDVEQLGNDITQGDEETSKSIKKNWIDPLSEKVNANSGNISDLTQGLSDEISDRMNGDEDAKDYALETAMDVEKRLNKAVETETKTREAGDQGVETRVNARIDSIQNSLGGNTSSLHELSSLELGRLEVRPFDAILDGNIDPYESAAALIEKGDLSAGDIVFAEKYPGFLAFNGETFSADWGEIKGSSGNDDDSGTGGQTLTKPGAGSANKDITETVKFNEAEYYGTLYPGSSDRKCRRPNRKSLFHNRADNSMWLWDGAGLSKVSDIQLLNALAARLETLIGKGDVSAVIDTFNEIEAFLAGVTNTETLTGLLQQLKSQVLGEVSEGYQPKGNYLLSADYTAANILSKIKTVDGAGSGIDADKIDGIDSKNLCYVESPVNIQTIESPTQISTLHFIQTLDYFGAFHVNHWCARCTLSEDENATITDACCGNIPLAGALIEVWNSTDITGGSIGVFGSIIRVTTSASADESGDESAVFIYRHKTHSQAVHNNWQRIANSEEVFSSYQELSETISDQEASINDLIFSVDQHRTQIADINSNCLKFWDGPASEYFDLISEDEPDSNTQYFLNLDVWDEGICRQKAYATFFRKKLLSMNSEFCKFEGLLKSNNSQLKIKYQYFGEDILREETVPCLSNLNQYSFSFNFSKPLKSLFLYYTFVYSTNTLKLPPVIDFSFNSQDNLYSYTQIMGVTNLDMSLVNTHCVDSFANRFRGAGNYIQVLNLSGWDTSNATLMTGMFYGSSKLTTLYLCGWDISTITDLSDAFIGCTALINVYGPISGIKADIDLSPCPLSYASALVFIAGLEEVEDTKTISFKSETFELLTDEDIASATSKGWSVVEVAEES